MLTDIKFFGDKWEEILQSGRDELNMKMETRTFLLVQ